MSSKTFWGGILTGAGGSLLLLGAMIGVLALVIVGIGLAVPGLMLVRYSK